MSDQPIWSPFLTEEAEECAGGLDLIGKKLFPIRGMKTVSGKYPFKDLVKGRKMEAADPDQHRKPGTPYPKSESGWSDRDFHLKDRGEGFTIDDRLRDQYKDMGIDNHEEDEVQRITEKQMLAHEILCNRKVFGRTGDFKDDDGKWIWNWAGASNHSEASVEYKWDNRATVDLVTDVDTVCKAAKRRRLKFNTVVMSFEVFIFIHRLPKLIEFLYPNGTNNGPASKPVTMAALKELLKVDNILIGDEHYIDYSEAVPKSKRGAVKAGESNADFDSKNIWSNEGIFFCNVQSGDFKKKGIGRTLVWDGMKNGKRHSLSSKTMGTASMFNIVEYRNNDIHSDVYDMFSYYEPTQIIPSDGYMLDLGGFDGDPPAS